MSARVPYVTDEEAGPDAALLFEGCEELLGRVPNSWRLYARSPKLALIFLPFAAAIGRTGASGILDARSKWLANIAAAMANQCEYCSAHNSSLGVGNGLSTEEIAAIPAFETSDLFSDKDKTAIRWALAVTRNEAQRDREIFPQLQKFFTADEIVELTWMVGYRNMMTRIHDALWVDIEDEAEVGKARKTARLDRSVVLDFMERVVTDGSPTNEHRKVSSHG